MLNPDNKCGITVKMLPGETRRDYLLRWHREYRKVNSEKLAKYAADRRAANPEKHAESMRRYYENHKAERNRSSKDYAAAHKEELREYMRVYRAKNKERLSLLNKEWRIKNPERLREKQRIYLNNRLKTDHTFRLKHYLRSRVRDAIHAAGTQKAAKTLELLGCTVLEFRAHLEKQFTPEMNWENYGSYWEIDHIIPVSKFDLTDADQQRNAFHYSNCRPLHALENNLKADTIPGPHQPFLL